MSLEEEVRERLKKAGREFKEINAARVAALGEFPTMDALTNLRISYEALSDVVMLLARAIDRLEERTG